MKNYLESEFVSAENRKQNGNESKQKFKENRVSGGFYLCMIFEQKKCFALEIVYGYGAFVVVDRFRF